MAGEIRAGNLSETVLKKFEELRGYLGTNTNTSTVEAMVNILHLQCCSSRRLDMFKKAATLVSARENLSRELQPSEIQEVSIRDGIVCVWARHQGQPYKLTEKIWEEGS